MTRTNGGTGRTLSLLIFSAICAGNLSPAPAKAINVRLEDLLEKAGTYCLRLMSSALDFTCTEEVIEVQYFPRAASKLIAASPFGAPTLIEPEWGTKTLHNEWLYDYQLIRKKNVITERRTMLKENGKKKRVENTSLNTHRIGYLELIMCPVGLFGPSAQKTHTYRLAGKDKIQGCPVIVVEAAPLPGGPPGLTGKAWVNPVDGSVLKTEWTPESLDKYELVVQFGRRISAAPIVKFISEYGVEKKGIRFLSSHKAVEAYRLFEGGRLFTRTKLSVACRDFKFFTVQTDVDW